MQQSKPRNSPPRGQSREIAILFKYLLHSQNGLDTWPAYENVIVFYNGCAGIVILVVTLLLFGAVQFVDAADFEHDFINGSCSIENCLDGNGYYFT